MLNRLVFLSLILPGLARAEAMDSAARLINIAGMLAVVLLVIVGLAFAARRVLPGAIRPGRHIRVLEVMPVGRNEKICLVKVGEQTLLLGVSAGGIQRLESWENWPDTEKQPSSGEFQKVLARLVKTK